MTGESTGEEASGKAGGEEQGGEEENVCCKQIDGESVLAAGLPVCKCSIHLYWFIVFIQFFVGTLYKLFLLC